MIPNLEILQLLEVIFRKKFDKDIINSSIIYYSTSLNKLNRIRRVVPTFIVFNLSEAECAVSLRVRFLTFYPRVELVQIKQLYQ
jgi:hypothetical protein